VLVTSRVFLTGRSFLYSSELVRSEFSFLDVSFPSVGVQFILTRKGISTTSVVYWSEFLATDPEFWVQFLVLPDFLKSTGFGTGATQSREYS
jgi:hypothetical protein